MPRRLVIGLAFWIAYLVPAPAADQKPKSPVVMVRLRSVDDLLFLAEYSTAHSVGEKERLQLRKDVESFLGKDHAGIDFKRPVGLVMFADGNPNLLGGLDPLLLLPIAQEKAFNAFLERHLGKPEKAKGNSRLYHSFLNLYTIMARQYALILFHYESPRFNKLPDPAALLASSRNGAVVVTVQPKFLPEADRKAVLDFFGMTVKSPAGESLGATELQRR